MEESLVIIKDLLTASNDFWDDKQDLSTELVKDPKIQQWNDARDKAIRFLSKNGIEFITK